MPTYLPLDWYDQVTWYDMVFDADTEQQADFVEAVLERHGRSGHRSGGRRGLEPACGSGRLVAALARRGWRVSGFDISEPMLSYARRRLSRQGLDARLFTGRMESFTVPRRFDLAHCLVSTFKYLHDEASARAHLHRVADALSPGGVYVMGLHLTDYDDPGRARERWVVRRGATTVTCNIQTWPADRRQRTERVRARLIVRRGGHERRYETTWTFRTYSAGQLKRLLRSVGRFRHVATHDFHHEIGRRARLDGEQLDVVLVLRKKERGGERPSE